MEKEKRPEQLDLDLSESDSLLSIPAGTHYWLMRARGGRFLTDFIEGGFISLGFNKITMEALCCPDTIKGTTGIPDIRQLVAQAYPEDSKLAITLHSNQIRQFVYEFNVGDVVIVPGRNSDIFAIGVIDGPAYDEPQHLLQERIENRIRDGINYSLTDDIKRRSVCWIKTFKRADLPKNLLFALNAQQTILRIEDGHSAINKLISPLFQDENGINLVIATQVNNGLSVQQLQALTEIASSVVSGDESTSLRIDTEKNSPITLTFIAQLLDKDTLHAILVSFAPYMQQSGEVVASAVTAGGIFFGINSALKILGGKSIKEEGLIGWVQDRHSQFLDNKRKKIELAKDESELKALQQKEKTTDISPAAQQGIASLNPKLKNSGTEIEPHSQTKSDGARFEPKEEKRNQKKKAKAKRSGHKHTQKDE
ncbi:hypothetical protein [Lacticaseibacillus parakribbianus]|uniref:hypothetical protein n=1 Tax=Lacticaseibacillus parakribbianus TaxID=2970927 RepID=UPI0021CB8E41|nr:hypothetical protein [Lacticaseibacillus parakribbianus]